MRDDEFTATAHRDEDGVTLVVTDQDDKVVRDSGRWTGDLDDGLDRIGFVRVSKMWSWVADGVRSCAVIKY